MRGTTPTHTFTLDLDTALLKTVRIIYSQMGRVIFVKTGGDVTLDGYNVRTTLTQEDTFCFSCSHPVEIQVRALDHLGAAVKTDVFTVPIGRCLENEVMA